MTVHVLYGDHSWFSGEWEDAPSRDVQIVLYRDPVNAGGWTMRHGAEGGSPCDFFRKAKDGSIVGMDLSGFIDHAVYVLKVVEPCGDLPTMIDRAVHRLGVVKQGRMKSTQEWRALYREGIERLRELQQAD
jgi:hypothetical protein